METFTNWVQETEKNVIMLCGLKLFEIIIMSVIMGTRINKNQKIKVNW